MRSFLTILLVGFAATSSLATIDPDPDQIGVYFDYEADINCTAAAANVPFFAYIIITNPSAAEIHGLEFRYQLTTTPGFENSFFRLRNDIPPGMIDLGDNEDPLFGEHIQSLPTPLPTDDSSIVFVTWQYLLLADFSINFHLGPIDSPTIDSGLPNYDTGEEILPLGVSSGDIDLPVATVNGDCLAVPNDAITFGHIKSLFR